MHGICGMDYKYIPKIYIFLYFLSKSKQNELLRGMDVVWKIQFCKLSVHELQ